MSNNNFRYQPFVAVSGNFGGKVPTVDDVLFLHEQEIYPTTSLQENCIEFEFQTDRNYYVDLGQSFWHWSSNLSKDVVTLHTRVRKKKEHKDESVVFTKTRTDYEKEQEEVARFTYGNNKMHSIFSNVEVYLNNQQI